VPNDVVDGTAVEIEEERGLVPHVQAHLAVGVGALAAMSDDDFDRNLEAMRKGVERAARMKEAIMVEDEDFGLIPGTKKPTLLKPGAEKLALAYGLTGRFAHSITYGDGISAPPITVVVDCYLHLGGHEGPVVAQGMGMASSWENRYRWRKGGRICPECDLPGVIFTKGRGGQWWHPSDAKPAGGCGANFAKDDERLTSQDDRQIENPDPFELGNTLLKMGEKRSYVDAVLRATASSGLFSQDMEDEVQDRTGARQPALVSGTPVRHPVAQADTTVPWLEVADATVKGAVHPSTPPFDMELRRGADDSWHFGFKLRGEDDKWIPQVLAEGQLAADIHDAAAGSAFLWTQPVTILGDLYRVPWDKPKGHAMPPFQRLIIKSLTTAEWTLPYRPSPEAEAGVDEADLDAVMEKVP
jgi:hypothetical protein